MNESIIANIEKYGKPLKAKTDLLNYLKGGKLSLSQAVKAKCYDCNGYYADGRIDCKVSHCPIYPWMPFNKSQKSKPKVPMSEERKKASIEALKKARLAQKVSKR
jgi:hypothetical protein